MDIAGARAKARQHEHDLAVQTTFYTVHDLAARWQCSPATVRSIPSARLPYTAVGRGAKRVHRRYDPADVARYEHDEARVA